VCIDLSNNFSCNHPNLSIFRDIVHNSDGDVTVIVDNYEDGIIINPDTIICPYSPNNDNHQAAQKTYFYSGNSNTKGSIIRLYIEYICPTNDKIDIPHFSLSLPSKSYIDKFKELQLFDFCLSKVLIDRTNIRDKLVRQVLSPVNVAHDYKVVVTKDIIIVDDTLQFENTCNYKNDTNWKMSFVNRYFNMLIPVVIINKPTIGLSIYDLTVGDIVHTSILGSAPDSVCLFQDNNRPYVIIDPSSKYTTTFVDSIRDNIVELPFSGNIVTIPKNPRQTNNIQRRFDPNKIIWLYETYLAPILDHNKLTRSDYFSKLYRYLNNLPSDYYLKINQAVINKLIPTYSTNIRNRLNLALGFTKDSRIGVSWSINPRIYSIIEMSDSTTLECFSSDSNHFCKNYCTVQFEGMSNGSIGTDFFGLDQSTIHKTLILNPPWDSLIISKITRHLQTLINCRSVYIFADISKNDLANIIDTFKMSGPSCNEVIVKEYTNSMMYNYATGDYHLNQIPITMVAINPNNAELIADIDCLMINEQLTTTKRIYK